MKTRLLLPLLTVMAAASPAFGQGVNDNMPTGQQGVVIIQRPNQPAPPNATPNRAADWGERRMYEPRIPRIQAPPPNRRNHR